MKKFLLSLVVAVAAACGVPGTPPIVNPPSPPIVDANPPEYPRTIFLYGYGYNPDAGPEKPWTDNGRLTFDRFDGANLHNLYYEAAVLAKINSIAPVLRGIDDDGFPSLAVLRNVVENFNHRFTTPSPTWTPFIDTGALSWVVSREGPTPFDFENDEHLELVWTNMLRPFFIVFDDRVRQGNVLNPIRLERTPNNRLLVTWWSIAEGVSVIHNRQSAQRLIDHLNRRSVEDGFGELDHIVDVSWPETVGVYGKHAWFSPDQGYSTYNHNGIITGVAVPGFRDPANAPEPHRVLPRRNGDVLREGLTAWFNTGVHYGFLESLTNIEESAGFYRSDFWEPNTLYLDIVRDYIEATAPPKPKTVIFAVHAVTDLVSRNPVKGAAVLISHGGEYPVNQDGYVAIDVPPGPMMFSVHHPDFHDYFSEPIVMTGNQQFDVVMLPRPPPYPFPDEKGRLRIEGKTFKTEDNELWQWRGYSWFLGYRKFLAGEDVTGDLKFLRTNGFNVVRVFGPLPWVETPDYRAENFNTERLGEFFGLVGRHGMRVEFVPITYPFQNESAQRSFVQRIYNIAAEHWNVFIEVANEPHVNKTNPVGVMKGVDRKGVLSAYGLYGSYYERTNPSMPVALDYVTVHTQRDSAWHRKARHAQEIEFALNKPTISDEPAKAIELNFNYPGGKRDPNEFVWHHAIAALWTPGSTLHTEEGKWGRVPKAGQLQFTILEAVRDNVWLKIGPEWQTGRYTGAHLSSSPVDGDGLKIDGQDIWTYSSLHPNKALSVRAALSAPKGVRGWVVQDQWGPSGSVVRLSK